MELNTQSQPKVRDDISFSAGEMKGDKIVYYVNDGYTDQFYRIGEREHFLFRRMDGRRTLDEISRDYESRFGRRLDERSWPGLFKILEDRQMLEGSADEEKLKELKILAKTRKGEGQGWFHRRFHLLDPDALLTRMLPWFRFMFRSGFVMSAVAAIVVLELWVLSHVQELRGSVWAGRTVLHVGPVAIGVMIFLFILHELAHGVACKYYGGVVNDMGIMWRYLYIYPYCKLDHIILFHKRWHRVYVAAAGTFVGLLMLVPFALIWMLAPAGSLAGVVSAKILTWYNVLTLVNLIPFVQLDGYFMLSHALGMAELRQESQGFLLKKVKHLFGGEEATQNYGIRERRIYWVYGTMSLIMTVSVLAFMLTFWYRMVHRFGNWGWVLLGGIVCLLVLRRVGGERFKKLHQRWRDYRHTSAPVAPQAS